MTGPPLCEKGNSVKLPLRKEIDDYSRSCERLIVAAASQDGHPFTDEEIQWVAYYAKEMTSLVDRLMPDRKPEEKHERLAMQDYSQTSEAVLKMKNFSDEERNSIRDSVADVRKNILDGRQPEP